MADPSTDAPVREPITRFFNKVDQFRREAGNAITEGTLDPLYNLARGMVRSVPQMAASIPETAIRTQTAGLVNPQFLSRWAEQGLDAVGLGDNNTAFQQAGEAIGPLPAVGLVRGGVNAVTRGVRGMTAPGGLADEAAYLWKGVTTPGWFKANRDVTPLAPRVPVDAQQLLQAPPVTPPGVDPFMLAKMRRNLDLEGALVTWHRENPALAPERAHLRSLGYDIPPEPVPDPIHGEAGPGWDALGFPPVGSPTYKTPLRPVAEGDIPTSFEGMVNPTTPLHPDIKESRNAAMYQQQNLAMRRKHAYNKLMESAARPTPTFFDPPVNPDLVRAWEKTVMQYPDVTAPLPPDVEWVAHRLQNEYSKRGMGPRVEVPTPSQQTKWVFGNEPVITPETGWEGLGAPPPLSEGYKQRVREAYQPKRIEPQYMPPTTAESNFQLKREPWEMYRQQRPVAQQDIPTSFEGMVNPTTPLHPRLEATRHRLMQEQYRESLIRRNAFYDAMDRMQGNAPPKDAFKGDFKD